MTENQLAELIAESAIASANDAVAFWAAAHDESTAKEHKDCLRHAAEAHDDRLMKAEQIGLFRPSHDITIAGRLTTNALLKEVIEFAICTLAETPSVDRGAVIERIISGAEYGSPQTRFSLGHLLAEYAAMLPAEGWCAGAADLGEDIIAVAWGSQYGSFLDVLHTHAPMDEYIVSDVGAALLLGCDMLAFLGVRYLPLLDLDAAEFFLPNGSREPLPERDVLHPRRA